MRRPFSRSARILRALTALATVWCLGCSAFEPMLAAARERLGESATESVAAARAEQQEMLVAQGLPAADGLALIAVPDDEDESVPPVECDCCGCHAPSPTALTAADVRPPRPALPAALPAALLSVLREPLVPPPQPIA